MGKAKKINKENKRKQNIVELFLPPHEGIISKSKQHLEKSTKTKQTNKNKDAQSVLATT